MSKLYLVKDGIEGVGCPTSNGRQLFNTNFYLITYDFTSNEGYVDKKEEYRWRLYTQVGQKFKECRYHHLRTFEECVDKLKELKGDDQVIICSSNEVQELKNYRQQTV